MRRFQQHLAIIAHLLLWLDEQLLGVPESCEYRRPARIQYIRTGERTRQPRRAAL